MFRIKKIYVSLIMIAAVCLVTGLSATDSFAQKGGKGRYRKVVKLKKDARTNGYKVTVEENLTYVQAIKVKDPETGELIEGDVQVVLDCVGGESEPDDNQTVNFTGGTSLQILIPTPPDVGEPRLDLQLLSSATQGRSLFIICLKDQQ